MLRKFEPSLDTGGEFLSRIGFRCIAIEFSPVFVGFATEPAIVIPKPFTVVDLVRLVRRIADASELFCTLASKLASAWLRRGSRRVANDGGPLLVAAYPRTVPVEIS